MRGVRVVLGLERERRPLAVGVTAGPDQIPDQEVAGVQLNTRLVGVGREGDAVGGV